MTGVQTCALPIYPARRIVGWYHTHPGLDVFFSKKDCHIHDNFFKEPWHVALVIDPKSEQGGFFIWNQGQISQETDCFDLDEIFRSSKESVIQPSAIQSKVTNNKESEILKLGPDDFPDFTIDMEALSQSGRQSNLTDKKIPIKPLIIAIAIIVFITMNSILLNWNEWDSHIFLGKFYPVIALEALLLLVAVFAFIRVKIARYTIIALILFLIGYSVLRLTSITGLLIYIVILCFHVLLWRVIRSDELPKQRKGNKIDAFHLYLFIIILIILSIILVTSSSYIKERSYLSYTVIISPLIIGIISDAIISKKYRRVYKWILVIAIIAAVLVSVWLKYGDSFRKDTVDLIINWFSTQ